MLHPTNTITQLVTCGSSSSARTKQERARHPQSEVAARKRPQPAAAVAGTGRQLRSSERRTGNRNPSVMTRDDLAE